MRKALALLILSALSCGPSAPVQSANPSRETARYHIGRGTVREFSTADGYLCVSYQGFDDSSLSCNWNGRRNP